MKLRLTAIAAALSVIALAQPLVMGTCLTLSTAGAMLFVPNKAKAENSNTNGIKYKSKDSNIFTSGDSVEVHARRLNNLLIGFWKFTPFSKRNRMPVMLASKNEDGTINVSYTRGTKQKPAPPTSYFYTIDHAGMISAKESNEILNLNDIEHMFAVITTIINDLYGDYDMKETIQKYMNSIVKQRN